MADVDAKIDLVQQQLIINGEQIDCFSKGYQQLSLRCVTRRLVTIEPHCEAVIPVRLLHRQSSSPNESVNQGLRILEPCGNRLEDKGLYVGRTLVSAGETGLVPLRILNTSETTQTIGAQTVVAVAKPVTGVAELELPEANTQCTNNTQQVEEDSEVLLPDPLKELWQRSTEQLTEEESKAVTELLHQYKDVFSLSEQDLGRTTLIRHHIDTGNARPIKQQPRRTSPSKHAEIERQEENLLQRGIVKKSNSPWSSPVVLVTKKDGSQRFCVDYREVNAATVKDAYPLPRVDDSLSALSGAKWFSTLDLASRYWQVPMAPASSGKAAFVTTSGLYEWTVMPFALTSSPITFERLMELILAGLRFETCLIYLDDKSVTYLGHVVSESGMNTDPAKVERVCEWPVPENATEVKSFLGLVGYYRRFVPNFAQVARPLHNLTQAKVDFVWTLECQLSFETMKTSLSTVSVLSYPDFSEEFILDTEASNHGIGAVLS
ncbi:hypothetical protein ACROYT_G026008 [Oculina patagonica]